MERYKNSLLPKLKKTRERSWLSRVSHIALQQSLNDLDQAYQNFFKSCKRELKGKPVKPPKFKKRRNAQSARFTTGGFKVRKNSVYIAKIGFIKTAWSRKLPSKPSSATVIKDLAGRYFVSFVVEIQPELLPQIGETCGIDLRIINVATFDDGQKVKAPKPLKKNLKRLRKRQKSLSCKQKGSNRREVARQKVAIHVGRRPKQHAKIKDTRTDFLHKLSTKVVKENQLIALEDLNVNGLIKNRKFSRAISDLGWREFTYCVHAARTDISRRKSREIRSRVSHYRPLEPTSQICSCCGEKGGKKELSVREWTCLWCSAIHDRDINAANNTLKVAGEGFWTRLPSANGARSLRGQSETLNGRGGLRKTTAKVAAADEASTPYSLRHGFANGDPYKKGRGEESPYRPGGEDVKSGSGAYRDFVNKWT